MKRSFCLGDSNLLTELVHCLLGTAGQRWQGKQTGKEIYETSEAEFCRQGQSQDTIRQV